MKSVLFCLLTNILLSDLHTRNSKIWVSYSGELSDFVHIRHIYIEHWSSNLFFFFLCVQWFYISNTLSFLFLSVAIIVCSFYKPLYTMFVFLLNKNPNIDHCLSTYIRVLLFWMGRKGSRRGIKFNRKSPYLTHSSIIDSNKSMQLSVGLFPWC